MSRNFRYLRYVLDESVTDEAKFSKKVVSGKRVADAIMTFFVKGHILELLGQDSGLSREWI